VAQDKNSSLTDADLEKVQPPVDVPETVTVGRDTPAPRPRTPMGRSQAQAWIGRLLGKYTITAFLGEGGMGVVFKAHDPMIDRDVAIKLLAQDLAEDDSSLARFLAEARAIGKLNHPNVLGIYEICQEGSTYFLVMEFLPGGTLGDQLDRQGPCSVFAATQVMIDACKGVAAAHAAGIFHRDLKPENLLRAADGTIKVMDFGLAKFSAANAQQLTQYGIVVGTPSFMSPEQCEAKLIDARSDIYALGGTYYALLTGKYPYGDTTTVVQVMYSQCHAPVPDPRQVNPAIPEACAQIIARAMAKDPAARYQSANELQADLLAVAATLSGKTQILLPSERVFGQAALPSKVQGPRAGLHRRIALTIAGGMILAMLFVLALFWRSGQRAPGSSSGQNGVPLLSGEPIKVGVLHSLSGTMASSGTVVVDATIFAIDQINNEGGVLGRPVQPVVVDGRSDWELFAREAERLIVDEKVCTIFGCWTSSSRKMVKPVVEKYDHLLVYPVQYEGLETSPCIVYMGAAPNQQIIPAVDWAMTALHKKRFFLVGSDYVFPRTANAIIKDHLKFAEGAVVGEKYLVLGCQKFQALVDSIVQSNPDMIVNSLNGDSNIAFFRALRAAGITPDKIPTVSFSVGEQELRGLELTEVEGDYAAWTYFQSLATPENQEFLSRFHKLYPQRSVTDPMEAAYVGVKLWARAVEEAQSLDPKKIRRAMLNQRLLAPDGEVRIDPETQHCFKTPRIGRIQPDGQFQIVWSAPQPVAPMPYPNTRTAAEWNRFLHDLYAGWGNRWAAPEEGLRGKTAVK